MGLPSLGTPWSSELSRSEPSWGGESLGVRGATAVLEVCSSADGGGGLTRVSRADWGGRIKLAGLGLTDAVMARKWASAWARTLAKPAGLVMRADWPASELAQRLHSSNSTAWSSSS